MDPQQYEEICKYVRDGKIPQNKDQGKPKKKFLAMCRRFRWKETALYRKTRTKEVKVLQRYQIIPLLYTLHEGPTGAYNGTERINKSKKDTTGLKCTKISEDMCKPVMLANEEEILKQIIYYTRSNRKHPFK